MALDLNTNRAMLGNFQRNYLYMLTISRKPDSLSDAMAKTIGDGVNIDVYNETITIPTRRSSDLTLFRSAVAARQAGQGGRAPVVEAPGEVEGHVAMAPDGAATLFAVVGVTAVGMPRAHVVLHAVALLLDVRPLIPDVLGISGVAADVFDGIAVAVVPVDDAV